MADLFSDAWMKAFAEQWNADPDLGGALEKIGFNSNVSFGFDGEAAPRGVLVVQNGKVAKAGAYNGEPLNWDMRASPENWATWVAKGLSMMGLGVAYTTRKMKFEVGDYKAMMKDPRMTGPFIKCFTAMGKVKV